MKSNKLKETIPPIGEVPVKKKRTGRPTSYNDELGRLICSRIAAGESLRKICKDNGMPNPSTVFFWLLDDDKKNFVEQYERARNVQAENLFDKLLEIADENNKNVMRARLRIDTRKWYLSKVLPKKFGEKLDVTSDGEKISGVDVKIVGNEIKS